MNKYEYKQNRVCVLCPAIIKDKNKSGHCAKHLRFYIRVENPSYFVLHRWLSYTYPKTGVCSFCKLNKRTAWALRKGCEYKRDIANFIELCYKCHTAYDWTEEHSRRISEGLKGRTLTPEHRKAISEGKKKQYLKNKQKQHEQII